MSSGLFVTDEDGDVEMDSNGKLDKNSQTSEAIEEDDPVVHEIPINLTIGPCPLHVLQFPNKPKKLAKNMAQHPPISGVRYKDESSIWELDVPLNTHVFFDKDKAAESWNNVDVQSLKGVAVDNDMLQYAGVMKQGQLYLIPVEKVAQMRPFFKYIDSQQQVRKDEDARAKPVNPKAKKNQVLTMSVKSSSEANQNRLGGALLAHKVAEEEEFKSLEWRDNTFEAFVEEVTKEETTIPLEPMDDNTAYLLKLF
ncbi:unnamed protein product [Kluyveromyces dobzhanskii CBS 2104]|uniref:WGS project CCBQ000000000 data, contig 00010 n=1 Tax=Kluyveromyces dobzhanskii CBS 2104 TaxID=1427455 RepID=A0A0A8LAD8_9SACH|nr:unnamed protein product [Kluyveromyces dobzhanskii CBS 2104]